MNPINPIQILWLVLLLAFAAGEGLTVGLTSIWFAAGALAALITSLAGGSLQLQVIVFLLVSLVCLFLVRSLARQFLTSDFQPTNADRVIGAEGIVTEAIDNLQNKGLVSVKGSVWTARSDAARVIPVGSHVRILHIEGVKLFVALQEEEVSCTDS